MTKPEHVRTFEKTKIELMRKRNTVFYTTILFSLKQHWADDDHPLWGNNKPTAAVDGVNIWFNPGFWLSLTVEERIFLVLHEIMHVALNHMIRRGNRDPEIWNDAGDYIINYELKQAGYTMPKIGLYNPNYGKYNVEQLYKILYKEAQAKQAAGTPGSGQPGNPMAGDIIYPANKKEAAEVKKKIEEILVRASIQSKNSNDQPGCMPGCIALELEGILNPKLPWNVILSNHMNNYAKEDYSMTRPNRRFMPDYFLPTAHSIAMSDLVVAVDSSGSTTHNDQFHYFVREVQSIQELCKPEKITLIDWDTQIRSIQEITKDTDIMNECVFEGGGGTNIHEVIDWIIEHRPEVAIIFSDGEFTMPKQVPTNTDVIWIIHNDDDWDAPYGTVIHYEMKEE